MQIGDVRLPHARDRGLLCRELPEGLMVYDTTCHQAHSLNRTAALVWRHCDGRTSVPELARRLPQELSLPADEAVVWLALEQLEAAQLLREALARPSGEGQTSRRAVMRKLGRTAGLVALLPLVASLAAPTPAEAQSLLRSARVPSRRYRNFWNVRSRTKLRNYQEW